MTRLLQCLTIYGLIASCCMSFTCQRCYWAKILRNKNPKDPGLNQTKHYFLRQHTESCLGGQGADIGTHKCWYDDDACQTFWFKIVQSSEDGNERIRFVRMIRSCAFRKNRQGGDIWAQDGCRNLKGGPFAQSSTGYQIKKSYACYCSGVDLCNNQDRKVLCPPRGRCPKMVL